MRHDTQTNLNTLEIGFVTEANPNGLVMRTPLIGCKGLGLGNKYAFFLCRQAKAIGLPTVGQDKPEVKAVRVTLDRMRFENGLRQALPARSICPLRVDQSFCGSLKNQS